MDYHKSLPPWERELKPGADKREELMNSRSLRGSVSWNPYRAVVYGRAHHIAPYVGAWIEMLSVGETLMSYCIAPCMGAWIETCVSYNISIKEEIAPRMGAWIETQFAQLLYCSSILSLPVRELELKRSIESEVI